MVFHVVRGVSKGVLGSSSLRSTKSSLQYTTNYEVKQEILEDESLSEEEKKLKIDALYAKPRTQKEMPMF